jgi:ATP-dependent RNA helicase DeaD
VATDVAARGLDVDDLEVVFNYELPHDPEDYVHRIGRTGRAGKSGRALSLVSGREFGRLWQIQRFIGTRIPLRPVPRVEELEQKATGRLVETLRRTLEAGTFKRQDALFEELTRAGYAPGDVVSALIHLLQAESGRTPERIPEDEPRAPRPGSRSASGGGAPFPRPRFEPHPGGRRGAGGDTAWIKFNLGANAGVQPGDFVGCIAGETGLPREVVGAIRILPGLSLVEVARAHLPRILEAVNRTRLKGRRVLAMPGAPPAAGPRPFRPGPAWRR